MSSSDLSTTKQPFPTARLTRRLAAMLYDALLLLALLVCTALLYTAIVTTIAGTTPEGLAQAQTGDVITELEPTDLGPLFLPTLAITYLGFFCYFWCRTGQTLGMLVWKIKLTDPAGGAVSLPRALARLATAALSLVCAGLGYWVLLLPGVENSWHDRLSGTRVVFIGTTKK